MFYDDNEELKELRRERDEIANKECRLRALAIAVRLAQAEYFATRSRESLLKSKSAESRLDLELFGKNVKKADLKDLRERYNDTDTN